ncbi:MAG TPA: hypothetical protein VKB34_11045, partial [Povalibacter sp.]|nr:hypothetical protein [Povalibacter sp.]
MFLAFDHVSPGLRRLMKNLWSFDCAESQSHGSTVPAVCILDCREPEFERTASSHITSTCQTAAIRKVFSMSSWMSVPVVRNGIPVRRIHCHPCKGQQQPRHDREIGAR